MVAIRVALADDHTLVRAGIRALLTSLAEVEVVGEVGDGEAAIALARQTQPDVLLMDISMHGLNGLAACARLREEAPAIKVIILSMHRSEEYVLQALQAGAVGYLIKDAAPAELELALQAVMRDETWLSPIISRQVVDGYLARLSGAPVPDPLTPRQRDILKRIAEGQGAKEIAWQLNISVKTVETHRAQLMDRLDIHDVPGLTRYAIRIGLVSAER